MRCAVLVVEDPCGTMLDFPQSGAFQVVPVGPHECRVEVFDVMIPELLLHQIQDHVGVFPAWIEVLVQESEGSRWSFLGWTLG